MNAATPRRAIDRCSTSNTPQDRGSQSSPRPTFPRPLIRIVLKGRFSPRSGTSPCPPPCEEYCDPALLERIHRRSLGLLRKEVEPVPLSRYADFLIHWQHLGKGDGLAGQDGLRTIMQQLRGVAVPGATWERDVLPARTQSYEP